MPAFWDAFKRHRQIFRAHWLTFVAISYGLDLLIQFLVIPSFKFATTWILQAGEIPFVSYQNVVTILTHHPLVVIALFLELLALLWVIYAQFTLLLIAVRQLARDRFDWRNWLGESWASLAHMRLGSLALLLGYLSLILPVSNLIFKTPLLTKVKVPAFILDYLTRNGWLISGTVIGYVVILAFGVRLLYTLPTMVYHHVPTKAAFISSWQRTAHGQWWPLVKQLLTLAVLTTLVSLLFYLTSLVAQAGFDLLPAPWPHHLATANLTLVQLGSEFLIVWQTILSLLVLIADELPSSPLAFGHRRATWRQWGLPVALIALFTLAAAANASTYFSEHSLTRPLTIAHRGVVNGNGVQNTIPALKKTAHFHPDFVEMDIHETKDHQFVAMHDENLRALTGVNQAPYQLTLRQLTALTAKENGHQAPVASFDQYLKAAQQLHQPLLVEIKTTPHDSAAMIQRFNQRYGATLLAHHDRVHSLDYTAVQQLQRANPALTVYYIQPYNFTFPNSAADGYSMEYSTLNQDFITQAHRQHKPVLAWDANEPAVIKQLIFDHADGLITDNLTTVQAQIKALTGHQSYLNQLANFLDLLPN